MIVAVNAISNKKINFHLVVRVAFNAIYQTRLYEFLETEKYCIKVDHVMFYKRRMTVHVIFGISG